MSIIEKETNFRSDPESENFFPITSSNGINGDVPASLHIEKRAHKITHSVGFLNVEFQLTG